MPGSGLCRLPDGSVPLPEEPLIDVELEGLNTKSVRIAVEVLSALSKYYEEHGVYDAGVLLVNLEVRKKVFPEIRDRLAFAIADHIRRGTLPPDTLDNLHAAQTSMKAPELRMIAKLASENLRQVLVPPAPPVRRKVPSK